MQPNDSRMTAPTPSGGGEPHQPSAASYEAEQEARRERLPAVLRSYATTFDECFVPDSDAGNVVRRAADEIESLRAALRAARRGEHALRETVERALERYDRYLNGEEDLLGVDEALTILRAALAATPEEA